MSKDYSSLRANIEVFRNFTRESYVYGLKDRDAYMGQMSSRRYDNHLRTIKDWFDTCIGVKGVTSEEDRKKIKYIKMDSKEYPINPLFKMWKACTFTPNEIVAYFFLISELTKRGGSAYKRDVEAIDYNGYDITRVLTEKILPTGIVERKEHGRYALSGAVDLTGLEDALCFYSEVAPAGVLGSFMMDKHKVFDSVFNYKNHYIVQALDAEIMCNLLVAIQCRHNVEIEYRNKILCTVPVKIYSSTQTGRQYLMAWDENNERFSTYRLDYIDDVTINPDRNATYNDIAEKFSQMQPHIWGVSMGNGELSHVEFCITVADNEQYIIGRILREKRCGNVTKIDEGFYKFDADVYDAKEMIPWIRSYICRIQNLTISDKKIEQLFYSDLEKMYEMYGIGDEW